jgi:hypothetical protein
MRWRPKRLSVLVLCLAAVFSSGACAREDRRIEQHRQGLQSLSSSVYAIASAWLAGTTSGTYTATALEQILTLVENERAALARNAETLIDPRGARLADAADELTRRVALLIEDVRASNGQAARSHLAALPLDREQNRQ